MVGAGGAATSPGTVLGVERSVCGRRWRSRPGDAREGQAIAERLGLPENVGGALGASRGALLPAPSHRRDMEAAAARLVRAVRDGQTVAIFGDYDVDGATSAALL